MATQNIPKIVLVDETEGQDTASAMATIKGVKTDSDADASSSPVDDTTLHGYADDTMVVVVKRKTDSSKTLTAQENELSTKAKRAYKKVLLYVQGVCNDVSVGHGDVNAGIQVATRCGFKQKKKKEAHPRGFEVVDSGPGWFHIRVKAVGKHAAYAWRCGPCPGNNTPPPPESLSPVMVTVECEVIIQNCKSAANYGFQFAAVLPVSHRKTKVDNSLKIKNVTPVPATKAKKATFNLGQEPLQWSDFIFDVGK